MPARSARFLVANVSPLLNAMAAIWASSTLIGRPHVVRAGDQPSVSHGGRLIEGQTAVREFLEHPGCRLPETRLALPVGQKGDPQLDLTPCDG